MLDILLRGTCHRHLIDDSDVIRVDLCVLTDQDNFSPQNLKILESLINFMTILCRIMFLGKFLEHVCLIVHIRGPKKCSGV